MKILYIATELSKISSGGDQINHRNRLLLKSIFKEEFKEISLKSNGKIATILNLFIYCLECLSPSSILRIILYIKKNNINNVFLASSKYGVLSLMLRFCFPNIKITVFFHNVEHWYQQELLKSNNTLRNHIITHIVKTNERLSVRTASDCWVLNERDDALLKSIYNKSSSLILPTSLDDLLVENVKKNVRANERFTLLFVGINFFANVDGVKWFIDKVLPRIDCKLIIVGKGMNKEKFAKKDNIEVLGFVEDLSYYYYIADVVVLPIFSGGGMKTKTAEAMMFGCPVVGTKEAFEGYSFDYWKAGGLCNTDDEFVETLCCLKNNIELRKKCAQYVREIFIEKYSYEAALQKLNTNFYRLFP